MVECIDKIKQTKSNRYRFPKRYRLIKTDEFSSVFNFRKRISGQFLAIHYRLGYCSGKNDTDHGVVMQSGVNARLGLIVAKKIVRRAVDRNYARRVIREWFRLNLHQMPCVDMVVRVQRKFGRNERKALELECQGLLDKLKQKCG